MAEKLGPSERSDEGADSGFPPTADTIATCPPHHWFIDNTRQTCRKCGVSVMGDRTQPTVPGSPAPPVQIVPVVAESADAGVEWRTIYDLRDDPVELFGEVGGRAVVACAAAAEEEIESVARELGVPLRRVGTAGGDTLLGVELSLLRAAWEGSDPAPGARAQEPRSEV